MHVIYIRPITLPSAENAPFGIIGRDASCGRRVSAILLGRFLVHESWVMKDDKLLAAGVTPKRAQRCAAGE